MSLVEYARSEAEARAHPLDTPVSWRRALLSLLAVVPALGLGAWHVRQYLPFMADDAFISLRYSQRFLEGSGLTWTDGERVEGYSNLLWVLACVAVGRFTDLISAARIVGIGSTIAIFGTLAFWLSRSVAGALCAAVTASLLALSGPVAVWAIGGLEQPLLCALLCIGAVGAIELGDLSDGPSTSSAVPCIAGLALGLMCLTRPDAPLLVAMLAAGVAISRGFRNCLKPIAWLAVPALLAVLGQLAFRRGYYGEWVPNTAHLKLGTSWTRLVTGWDYVLSGFRVWLPFVGFALSGILACRLAKRSFRPVAGVACALVAWTAYVVIIGGDIFPARRHLLPCLMLLSILGAWGLRAVFEQPGKRRWLTAPLAAACLALGAAWGTSDPRSFDAPKEKWEWEGEASGRLFADAFAPLRPLLAVHSAGCVPFFSRLPSLDMLGLNDAWIARHRPPRHGEASVGHDLHAVGDPEYILNRQPDLIVPCGPLGGIKCPSIPAAAPLFRYPRFAAEYAPMHFQTNVPFTASGTAWVRMASPIAVTMREDGYTLRPAALARGAGTLRMDRGKAVVSIASHGQVVISRRPQGGQVEPAGLAGLKATIEGDRLVLRNPGEAPVVLAGIDISTR